MAVRTHGFALLNLGTDACLGEGFAVTQLKELFRARQVVKIHCVRRIAQSAVCARLILRFRDDSSVALKRTLDPNVRVAVATPIRAVMSAVALLAVPRAKLRLLALIVQAVIAVRVITRSHNAQPS